MQLDNLQGQHQFHIRQRLRMMVNQYEVRAVSPDGTEGELLAFAQQKRLAFKEQVTIYTDDSKQQPLLGFKARQRIDLGATYDVTDAAGNPIGLFRKDFAQSLLRSTWHVEQGGLPQVTGQERSMPVALLRRFVDCCPGCPTTSTSPRTASRSSPWSRSGACATSTSSRCRTRRSTVAWSSRWPSHSTRSRPADTPGPDRCAAVTLGGRRRGHPLLAAGRDLDLDQSRPACRRAALPGRGGR